MIDPKYSKGLKITSGKGDYIQKRLEDTIKGSLTALPPGTTFNETDKHLYKKICLCDYNIDLSPGCISNTLPKDFDLEEWRKRFLEFYSPGIIADTTIFDPKAGERSATRHNCVYCYARRTNYHTPLAYAADESTWKGLEQDIIDNNIKHIRLGKKVECGNKENRGNLIKILEIGAKHGVQFIFPTKYLEFDKTVANLLNETRSALGFSIGADRFEDGACSHGYDNKFRLQQAHKYLDYGVNTILKVVTDMTASPKEAKKHGWFTLDALMDFPIENIEMLPVRIKSKEFAFNATGESWKILQSPKLGERMVVDLGRKIPRYVMEEDITVLIANYFHESYYETGIVQRNQICGHIGAPENGTVYCDMCHLTDEHGKKLEAVSFPMSMLPPSPGSERSREGWYDRNNWKKVYHERFDSKYQQKLFKSLEEVRQKTGQNIPVIRTKDHQGDKNIQELDKILVAADKAGIEEINVIGKENIVNIRKLKK